MPRAAGGPKGLDGKNDPKNKVFCKLGKSGFQGKIGALSRSRPLFLRFEASRRVKGPLLWKKSF